MPQSCSTVPSPLIYRLCPEQPHAHQFAVEIEIPEIPASAATSLFLTMPAWIPGSYMIRDFARNILTIAACDAEGKPLPLTKCDKQTWVCERPLPGMRVRYRVFAWDFSVHAAHLDQRHAYFNGPAVFLRVVGQDQAPCLIELTPPEDGCARPWRVATTLRALETDARGFGRYEAEDYAELIDHPVEMAEIATIGFSVLGVPHEVILSGRHQADTEALARDLRHICTQHVALFGELPLERYRFLVQVVEDGYGGLEHRDSCSLICARDDLAPSGPDAEARKGYVRFLGLCSHEYFHLWNVKRIRPQAFIEARLDAEVHTRLLWAFEGITSYYDELALVRAGCIDTPTYLGLLAETITRVRRTPGRRLQTLAEASFDAWTRFYKPDDNAPNALVSYYAKGALVALALDLTLRLGTEGRCSLDHLMRELWRRYGLNKDRPGRGVGERDIEALAMELSGLDLHDFFARALDSTEELELAPLLAELGIGLRLRPARDGRDLGGYVEHFEPLAPPRPTLGLRLRTERGEAVVQSVLNGSAGERAGIAPGDQLVALDGLRVMAETLDAHLARAKPGATLSLHLFRRDELLALEVCPEPAEPDTCELCLLAEADAHQQAARAAWLASLV